MTSPTVHVPVLLTEVIELLAPRPGQSFVDGTLGGGGHTREIAARVTPGGRVLAVDLDPAAIERTQATLGDLPVDAVQGSYDEIPSLLAERDVAGVGGILLDLGLSSDQFEDAERGFSFNAPGPLDLRFDPERSEAAWQLVNRLREEDLANVIYRYGEERLSRRIAKRLVEKRSRGKVWTAAELADAVRSCVPRSRGHAIDPATRTFQALRIAVNDELGSLERALASLPDCLTAGGRLAIISFHSLEDRLVKHAFRNDPRLTVVTRRPVTASDEEIARNPRARSAKLRVAERATLVVKEHGICHSEVI